MVSLARCLVARRGLIASVTLTVTLMPPRLPEAERSENRASQRFAGRNDESPRPVTSR
jgi:hypothetical protein